MRYNARVSRFSRVGLVALAATLLIQCGPERIGGPVSPGVPTLSILPGPNGGENQTGVVGATLAKPIVVQVGGLAAGESRNNQILNFIVTSGSGTVFASVVKTSQPTSGPGAGQNGIGLTTWTLGPTAGPQTVEARLIDPDNGVTLTQATFHATATAGPASLIKVSGGNQLTATAGTAVAPPPAVLVTDQYANPITGVPVAFAVASGGGSITGASATTGANGIATLGSWTLGPTAGPNTVTATRAGLTGSPVSFAATGAKGVATQLVLTAGNGQSGVVGSQLPTALVVRARDANANGVPGVAVTFAVTGGGGNMGGISSVTTLTDTSGSAKVNWQLGTSVGPNTIRAAASGLTGSPLTFTATATASGVSQIKAFAGDQQTATAGSAVAASPAVVVTDAFGNPISGVAVTFAVAGGGGSISGPAATTGANGVAAVGSWTLGTLAGSNTVTATSTGLSGSPVTFAATGTNGPAAQLVLQGGNGQSAPAGAQLPSAVSVRTVDVNGNAVPGVAVTFSVVSGGGNIDGIASASTLSDMAGNAAVRWTVGTEVGPDAMRAVAPGLSGSPVTFSATTTAGPPANISATSPTSQSGTVGGQVSSAPAVTVSDQYGNATPGIAVAFTVVTGGGSVAGSPATTDASGNTGVGSWTLGTLAGSNRVRASVAALGVNFDAAGVAGPLFSIAIVSGNNQSGPAGAALPAPIVVSPQDQYGNGVAATINFVAQNGGSAAPPQVLADGISPVSTQWTLGPGGGPQTLVASDAGTSGVQVSFSATAVASCDCWTTLQDMPTARFFLAGGVINGKFYAVGGAGGMDRLEAYDPATNAWTTKAVLPTGRYGLGVVVINGILYAVGGIDVNSNFVGTLEAYDPATDTWTSRLTMPTARAYAGVGVVNGMLYVAGGANANGYLGTVEAYDPVTNAWTTGMSMLAPRAYAGAAVAGGKLYVIGGSGSGQDVEAYDPASNSWSTRTAMPTSRSTLGVAEINGLLYAVGGAGVNYLSTNESFNPATNSWTTRNPMFRARNGVGVGVIAGILYVAGGNSPNPYLATLEAYQP